MDIKGKTVLITGAGRGIGMKPEVLAKITAPVPVQRLGEPAEIAQAVGFIFANDFFTGRCLEADGGLRF